MFVVVGDQIVKAKAVVRSDVIDALSRVVGVVEIVRKQIAAAVEAGHEISNFSSVAFDKRANVISKPAIPLAPCLAGEAAAQFVTGRVPCLGDQANVGIVSAACYLGNQWRVFQVDRAVDIAAEDGSEIESETVDMHLKHPETETVDYHLAHRR